MLIAANDVQPCFNWTLPMTTSGNQANPVDAEKVRAQLRKWQERLLDLKKSNPLLGLNRSRVSKLRVKSPAALELFTMLVSNEAELRMPFVPKVPTGHGYKLIFEDAGVDSEERVEKGDVEFEASASDLMRRLRRIHDNARTTVEERGVTTLFLTFGALCWRDDWLDESISPLWMVPCQFKSQGPNVALRLSLADEEMQLNPAIELYLRERHKVNLPQIDEETAAPNLAEFLKKVQRAVEEQQWQVTEDIWLSTFSFESLVLYKDLKNMADAAIQNHIVAALAQAIPLQEGSERMQGELDDLPTPDVVPVPVLPADSSQLEAITLAVAGRNEVIHGPPGTGKSQTISSIIAEALGRGRKVLFVSAKMAALNVVYERLAAKGLGRFCLEAHSTKVGKARVIDELRKTLEAEATPDDGRLPEQLEVIGRARQRLNAYVQALHQRVQPLGATPYQLIGKVAKLDEIPDIRADLPWPDVLKVSKAELQLRLEVLDELANLAGVFDSRADHPWDGFEPRKGAVVQQELLESCLTTVAEWARSMRESLLALDPLIPKDRDLSIIEAESLAGALYALSRVDRLPRGWWGIPLDQLRKEAGFFADAGKKAKELQAKAAEYQSFLDIDSCEAAKLLEPAKTVFEKWHKRLSPSFWRWRSSVRMKLKPGAKRSFPSLLHYQGVSQTLCDLNCWFNLENAHLGREVPTVRVRDPEVLRGVASRFNAAALLVEEAAALGIQPPQDFETVSPAISGAAKALLSDLPSRCVRAENNLKELEYLWPKGFVGATALRGAGLLGVVGKVTQLLAALPQLREWLHLLRVLRKCRDEGLSPFVESFGKTSAKLARPAFEKRFCAVWLNSLIQTCDVLAEFTGESRAYLVRKFRSLDREIQDLQAKHICAVASTGAQKIGSAQANLGNISEVGILRRELQKKKRIRPLRRLFADVPNVLQALKPCMLMSPISVSTFLKPGSCTFDLVIFDEASQIPTAEAIPSILRANAVIVAGDSNQLPPSAFFEASVFEDRDEFEDEIDSAPEPLESLLDDCKAIVPVFQEAHLKWHYRSRDERLIKFSNHSFYDNTLITFPCSCTDKAGRGVHLEYVLDGVWDRGRSRTNRAEALRVAHLVLRHFETFPGRSLGVVAMNRSQKELIEDLVTEEVRERPDVAALMNKDPKEAFFVKSLENVQGDERDTMIISVGYGKDADAHLTLNFGPLNMEGGWRRLNVLVTRAKWQTILVTSLKSRELAGISPQNRGALALKNFIEYAERDCELPHPSVTLPPGGETNDFEDAVREALVQRGITVDAQVGASKFRIDLAIRDRRDPQRYVLGIECDGATYHSSRTARDRDLLREEVLRRMGWRIHRVWSTEWFHNRDAAILSILRSLELAEATPPEESVEAPPVSHGSDDKKGPHQRAAPQGESPRIRKYQAGQPYRKVRAEEKWRKMDFLLRPSNVARLAELIVVIVGVEGPLHEGLIVDRLKQIYEIDRISANSTTAVNIMRAIGLAVGDKRLQRGQNRGFLLVAGAKLTHFRLPNDGVERSIDMIAPEEIEFAILHLVEDQFGMQRDRVPQAVAHLLGIKQLRAEGATLIGQIVDGLVERGVLRASGFQVYLA